MKLPIDIFLALRFLRPRRNLISIITLLSVLGPVLGVTVLLVVISVMSGFDRDIRQRILDTQAHLQVYPRFQQTADEQPVLKNPDRLVSFMEEELAFNAAPLIETPVLIQNREQTEIKYVRGVEPEAESEVTNVSDNVRGNYQIKSGEALVGERIAQKLGLMLGDKILLHSPYKFTSNIEWEEEGEISFKDQDTVYLPEEAVVAGIFSMGVYEFDDKLIYLHIDQAAELTGLDWGVATSVHAQTPDPFEINKYIPRLEEEFPGYHFVTWQEENEQLFNALNVEKNLMFFVLFIIVIVAAFCIAGTLITVVIQKTREIAIMKAVGISGFAIARIFLFQGAVIGFLGCLGGTGLALVLIRFRDGIAEFLGNVMGVPIFPAELYHLNSIPALLQTSDVLFILVLTFATCVLAAFLPALYASFLSPARALQEEG